METVEMNGLGYPVEGRRGDWMQVVGGGRFWPLDPRPEEISIVVIASALSKVCRFGGHVREFYSVAQHCVLVSHTCDQAYALEGLLHDAHEAFVGDMVRPLKLQPEMQGYRDAEAAVDEAVRTRFHLLPMMPRTVKWADEVLLATEARDLLSPECLKTWRLRYEPLPARIEPWSPARAQAEFLKRFHAITGEAAP